jgi:predicted O-linked N-acetylglucosamine transferase (SPINDLY family)
MSFNNEKFLNNILDLLKSDKLDDCINILSEERKKTKNPIYENIYGIVLAKKSLISEAKSQFLQTIDSYPEFPDALYNLGTILMNENDLLNAEIYLKKSIDLRDNYYEAIFNLANVYRKIEKVDEAINLYKKCEHIYNQDPEIYNGLGLCFAKKKNYSNAIEFFNKAIKLSLYSPELYNNLALVYYDLGDFEASLNLLERATSVNPNFAEAYINIGNIYREAKEYEKSKFNYLKALDLNNKLFQSYYNLARLDIDIKKDFFSAIENLKQAVQNKKDYHVAHNLLATCYLEIFDEKNALLHFEQSINNNNVSENLDFCLSSYIFNSNYINNFSFDKYLNLTSKLAQYYNNKNLKIPNFSKKKDLSNSKIKIGFFTADFFKHSVGYQTIELVKLLSNNKEFEIYAYYNKLEEDNLTLEFKKYFFKWTNLYLLSESNIIDLVRKDNLNIAIDLSGHTKGNLLNIFFHRVANIQISWCGYLNSTGISNIDYILGDKFVFDGKSNTTVEKKLKLNFCWSHLPIPTVSLNYEPPFKKNGYITFGCFNAAIKLNENLLNSWGKILKSVNNSVLYLKNKNFINDEYLNFLKDKFEKLGVKRDQLIFEKSSPREELLSCYNKVDIALDTYPYNGGTTTLEAYSMCVPVLTLVGENFISRCGYSINSNLDLNDWSCFSYDEYIEKGIYFAKNIKLLEEVRKYLIENRKKTSVFNSEIFTKDFTETIKTVIN